MLIGSIRFIYFDTHWNINETGKTFGWLTIKVEDLIHSGYDDQKSKIN